MLFWLLGVDVVQASSSSSSVAQSIMCLRESRDPRFDSLSGTLDNDRFRARYAFLYDEQLPAEREQIKGSLKVTSPSRRWLLCLEWPWPRQLTCRFDHSHLPYCQDGEDSTRVLCCFLLPLSLSCRMVMLCFALWQQAMLSRPTHAVT